MVTVQFSSEGLLAPVLPNHACNLIIGTLRGLIPIRLITGAVTFVNSAIAKPVLASLMVSVIEVPGGVVFATLADSQVRFDGSTIGTEFTTPVERYPFEESAEKI